MHASQKECSISFAICAVPALSAEHRTKDAPCLWHEKCVIIVIIAGQKRTNMSQQMTHHMPCRLLPPHGAQGGGTKSGPSASQLPCKRPRCSFPALSQSLRSHLSRHKCRAQTLCRHTLVLGHSALLWVQAESPRSDRSRTRRHARSCAKFPGKVNSHGGFCCNQPLSATTTEFH